ncbi:hypothetical protein [uncultured Winogradskyella sp.]|uniref:hypothetical protein n=1 Tax=uncultured Winogradskyella sp. TaxID=395353 RepID=UPI002610FFFF|nr:hypothetical protein [uncultured Winogradskyella sp.]
MNKTLFIIFAIISSISFGQNLSEKVGVIEIQLIGQNYKRNSDDELTKRKTNRRKRPYAKLYFNSSGILLKKITFGKHHNTDLRLTDKIKVYEYNNGKLTESIQYESDYQKSIYPYWKIKFTYNSKDQIIDESRYHILTDSLYNKTTFEYDLNSNQTKSILNPTYYYQREYDSLNRVIYLKQVYDNKLRWDWKYEYKNNRRIGIFQTYYDDGDNSSKLEIKTYNKNGQLIECEEKYTSKLEIGNKTKLVYDKNGLLEKVEYFETYDYEKDYEMIGFKIFKVKTKLNLDLKLSESINEQIEIR